MKEPEKLDKYQDLAEELKILWNVKMTPILEHSEQSPRIWKRD